jgi:drug/metabolite transporter (DMT)-like permease
MSRTPGIRRLAGALRAFGGRGSPAHCGVVLVVLAAACWSTLGVLGRIAYDRGVGPQATILWRTLLAALLGAVLLAVLGRLRRAEIRRAGRYVVPLGVIIALNYSGFFHAVASLGAAVAVALFSVYPAFAVLVGWIFLREPLSVAKLVALGAAVLGSTAVSGAFSASAGLSTRGIALALMSAAAYVGYMLCVKRAVRAGIAPLLLLVGGLWSALPWLAVGALVAGQSMAPPTQADAWLPIVLLATIPTLLGYWLFVRSLRHLEASTAAIASSVEPALGILLAVAVLGESATIIQGVGMTLLVGAALLIRVDLRSSTPRPP